jgi:hypothetical protein
MSQEAVNVLGILSPAPGKAERAIELLASTAKDIHEKVHPPASYLAFKPNSR